MYWFNARVTICKQKKEGNFSIQMISKAQQMYRCILPVERNPLPFPDVLVSKIMFVLVSEIHEKLLRLFPKSVKNN